MPQPALGWTGGTGCLHSLALLDARRVCRGASIKSQRVLWLWEMFAMLAREPQCPHLHLVPLVIKK